MIRALSGATNRVFAGTFIVVLRALGAFSLLCVIGFPCFAQVTTSQYDNLRTGATLREKTLPPQNVNAREFGKLGAFKVDGAVYAQPLFIPGLEIPGKGNHDVLFIATEHDRVYAFDADHLQLGGRANDALRRPAVLLCNL